MTNKPLPTTSEHSPSKSLQHRIKRLIPSLREKKRYVAFEVLSAKELSYLSISIDAKQIQHAIWDTALSFLGERHVSKAGLFMLPNLYQSKIQRGIIRVNHTGVDDLKAVLALVQQIQNQPVSIKTVGVSGILKKATARYLSHTVHATAHSAS